MSARGGDKDSVLECWDQAARHFDDFHIKLKPRSGGVEIVFSGMRGKRVYGTAITVPLIGADMLLARISGAVAHVMREVSRGIGKRVRECAQAAVDAALNADPSIDWLDDISVTAVAVSFASLRMGEARELVESQRIFGVYGWDDKEDADLCAAVFRLAAEQGRLGSLRRALVALHGLTPRHHPER